MRGIPGQDLSNSLCYNNGMTEEELNTISNNIKEKIGEEAFATISDDMGKIITGRETMAKDIKERDDEITGLKDKNQKLVDANASLFKQIPKSSDEKAKDSEESEEGMYKNIPLSSAFDKSGNFKH